MARRSSRVNGESVVDRFVTPSAGNSHSMSDSIHTYLNDHLAGSAAALDLIEALKNQVEDDDFRAALEGVHGEILEDRETLVSIMERLGIAQTTVKQLGGRLGEKALRFKSSEMVTDDPAFSELLRTETLVLGITGKEAGWAALRASQRDRFADIDFDTLIDRARDQKRRLEPFRLAAASASFASAGSISAS